MLRPRRLSAQLAGLIFVRVWRFARNAGRFWIVSEQRNLDCLLKRTRLRQKNLLLRLERYKPLPVLATTAFSTAGDVFSLVRSLLNDADIPSVLTITATGAARAGNAVTITTSV